MNPVIAILLTTYKRTDAALRTIQAIKKNMEWDQVYWHVSDDGSDHNHVSRVVSEIGSNYRIEVYNSNRRGVGHGMNYCLREIFKTTPLVITLEDDWELNQPLNMRPYVDLLTNHVEYGMIRFGYLAPNLLGYLVSEEGKLFWRLEPNGETYRFTGHPSLRHQRFFEQYGYYYEGLAPGATELTMCGAVNANPNGPHIVYPAECGQWGFWGHTGGESLADITPL